LLALALPAYGQGFLASEFDSTVGKAEVYYRGYDSNIYEIVRGNPNTWYQRTGLAGEGPSSAAYSGIAAYVNTIYNGNEVFYLTEVNGSMDVEQLWGGTFSPTNLTARTNALPAVSGSALVGYIDPIAGSDNVFYVGSDQKVHLLLWTPAGGWSSSVVDAGAPTVAGTSLSGHYKSGPGTFYSEEVFYLGANQHVYELWRWSKNFDGWHLTDVTEANGSKPVAAVGSPLAGFYDTAASTDVMFYLGTNQNLYELLFSTGAVWSGDMTTQTGSLNAASTSKLAAHLNTNNGGSDEVYFESGNQNVFEFWAWSSSQTAFHENSFPFEYAAVGSPLATDMNGNADELYYIGSDSNIFELFSSADITTSCGAPLAQP
jgi:hypothetical protein